MLTASKGKVNIHNVVPISWTMLTSLIIKPVMTQDYPKHKHNPKVPKVPEHNPYPKQKLEPYNLCTIHTQQY